MKLYLLYQTDTWKSKSSKVLFGVFDEIDKALDAAKENELETPDTEIVIEEKELNEFSE